ncbi:MAG: ethanolamine permease [Kofleriaceae bacterium]
MSALQRTLGPVAIWGLGVGYVISGMYFGWNLGLPEGGPYGMLVATAAVTVLYIAFVLGYAELTSAIPRAGGVFVYAGRAFGPNVGFVAGMAQLIEYVMAPTGIAFAIGGYINQVAPAIPIHAVAIAGYILFTLINMWGVKLSAVFEIALTVMAVIELCVFGFVVLPHFSWAAFSLDALPNGWWGTFGALPFAIWFYLGIEGLANVAEDARDPQRDLPRGFFAAMVTLVILTVITMFGAVGTAGWHAVVYPDPAILKTSDSPLPLAIGHVVSRDNPAFVALTGVGLIGLLASFLGILIAASRAILELGRARFLPAKLGEVHATRHTPIAALAANLVVGLVILVIGHTEQIIVISVFGALTMYAMSAAAVLRLRKVEPDLERPYKAPLYPYAPIVALVLSLICMAAMAKSHPYLALLYLGLLVVSWVGFVLIVPEDRRLTAFRR